MKINLYGLLIACAIFLASILLQREGKKRSLYKDVGIDMILYTVPFGIIGARIYYVAFSFEQYLHQPWRILYVWEGGLAVYGGVLGGLLGLYLLSKKKNISLLTLTDMALPAVLLGQAIGRWGNFFNQEAHGALIANPAYQFFPIGVQINEQWYYATFFYESAWNLMATFALFMLQRKTRSTKGFVTLFYFLLYGLGRCVVEQLRTDSLMLGSLRVSQILSLVLVIISTYIIYRKLKVSTKSIWFTAIAIIIVFIGILFQKFLIIFVGSVIFLPVIVTYFMKASVYEAANI